MYKLEYLPRAHNDMVEIVSYISHELKSPSAADRLSDKLVESIEKMMEFPYANPAYIPIRPLEHEYRKMIVDNFIVFYWVDEEKKHVTIARVIYHRRNLETVFEK